MAHLNPVLFLLSKLCTNPGQANTDDDDDDEGFNVLECWAEVLGTRANAGQQAILTLKHSCWD